MNLSPHILRTPRPPGIQGEENSSSPHTWGTPVRLVQRRDGVRFIPTYVRNSYSCSCWTRPRTVHPHMRGELTYDPMRCQPSSGSSTHTWGTRLVESLVLDTPRFIPTCVGNSPLPTSSSAATPVHPHIRGELIWMWPFGRYQYGSSPHTWGTHGPGSLDLDGCRFIPTYVGNSRMDG